MTYEERLNDAKVQKVIFDQALL